MRTTLTIDDDVLEAMKRHAEDRSVSLGRAATDLLRRALETDCPTVRVNGLTVLDPGPRSEVVAAATVRRLVEAVQPQRRRQLRCSMRRRLAPSGLSPALWAPN